MMEVAGILPVGAISGLTRRNLVMYQRFVALGCALAVSCLAHSAVAQPHGEYQVTAFNFPGNYSDTVTFDGIPEFIGTSPLGMVINERATNRPGTSGGIATNLGPALGFEESGIVVEYIYDTEDGLSFNDLVFDGWSISASNVDFGFEPWRLVQDTFFGFWRTPDGPVTIPQSAIDLGLTVGPHPTDPTIGQVVFFGNDPEEFPEGLIFFDLAVNSSLSSGALEFAFGVAPLSGLTIGAMYQKVNADVTGDTDDDGDVDITDLNNVRNNFGSQGNPIVGDTAPFNGIVDITDLNNVRNNFGVGPGGSPVPEAGAAAHGNIRWRVVVPPQ